MTTVDPYTALAKVMVGPMTWTIGADGNRYYVGYPEPLGARQAVAVVNALRADPNLLAAVIAEVGGPVRELFRKSAQEVMEFAEYGPHTPLVALASEWAER